MNIMKNQLNNLTSLPLLQHIQILLKSIVKRHLYKRDKISFLSSLCNEEILLDVGCGNASPKTVKDIKPNIYYVGIDVGDYNQNQDSVNFADEYNLIPSEDFAASIERYASFFTVVISSHNLEHCDEPERVIRAISKALKPNGRLFLSFPSEDSTKFPSRDGTLNFYDDPTHQNLPVYHDVIRILEEEGIVIEYKTKNFRPLFGIIIGVIMEPLSKLKNKVCVGTWSLYGFESVIWGKKQIHNKEF
jgi:SAM-dependent methyltransferase